MQIAILTSPITVGDYRELFSNTSFNSSGPSDEFLTANNAKKVTLFKAHDRLTQKLVSCAPYDDGEFVSMAQVESLGFTPKVTKLIQLEYGKPGVANKTAAELIDLGNQLVNQLSEKCSNDINPYLEMKDLTKSKP